MNTDALKAYGVALISQVLTLLVAYGIMDNMTAAKWLTLSMTAVNATFPIVHAIHATHSEPVTVQPVQPPQPPPVVYAPAPSIVPTAQFTAPPAPSIVPTQFDVAPPETPAEPPPAFPVPRANEEAAQESGGHIQPQIAPEEPSA
jgi:hypothetical protein